MGNLTKTEGIIKMGSENENQYPTINNLSLKI